MFEKLVNLHEKYMKLQEQLTSQEVLSDPNKIKTVSKELKELEAIEAMYHTFNNLLTEIDDAKELLEEETDPEMKQMLQETITSNEKRIKELEEEVKILLLPKDPNDGKNAIVEIRGAAGGDEANIFAGDLYRMYTKYFDSIGFKTELLEAHPAEAGGYSLISMLVKGENVFSQLKFESGSHRVQRVPVTESQGRIHTSTATVVVMPEVEDVEVEINENDLKIDVYRSGGAGGQSVNTTDSAVRITHLPTGIVVACQNERSQLQNKEQGMKILRAKLYDHFLQEQMDANDSERKSKLGTGARSEKIRTYNYPQNRVTDHRIGLTLNKLDQVMEGKLDEIIQALIVEDQLERLESFEQDHAN